MVNPPVAPRHPVTRSFHGHSFIDDYEWMRDKTSQATLDHLNAENEYTKTETSHLEQLTENIYSEIKSRVKQTDMSDRKSTRLNSSHSTPPRLPPSP